MKRINSLTQLNGWLILSVVLLLLTAPQHGKAQMQADIFQSVSISDFNALSLILESGEDVNQQTRTGMTPLMIAAKIGDSQIINSLLVSKADVNLQNNAGGTAMMLAAKYGHPHVIEKLLEHGADPTIQTKRGYTAAIFARGYKHMDVYEQLLEAEKKFKKQARRKAKTGS